MANITVSTNPSTTNNTLTVNFATDVTNITDIQLTKDGSNYISATSFTDTSATFNVASWTNGTYNNCYLKVIYTETSSGGNTGGGDSGGSSGGNPGGDSGLTTELTFRNGKINPSNGAEESDNVIGITDFIQYSTNKKMTCTTNNCYLDIFIYDNNYNFEGKQGYNIGDSVDYTLLSTKKYRLEITPSDWVTQITNSNYKNFLVNFNIVDTGGSTGGRPATYTITRNVTNCTSTGSSTIDTSITTTFQSVVTPNDGYTLTTLTVSMGGVDYTNRPNVITDTEWNGKPAKQITIENVNGNIVITANATQQSTPSTGGGSGGDAGGDTGGDSGELTYTSAVTGDFTTVGDCDGISIDSNNNLVASTLDQWGAVILNKPVRKLQFNVRDNQDDYGILCYYIYNTYKDGADNKYNMITLSNVAGGENGKLFKMDIPGTYSEEIDKLDIPTINPGEQLTIEITASAPTIKQYKDDRLNNTIITNEVITTHTIKRADGTILTTLTGNMSAWCGQSTNSSPFCSNIKYVPEVVYDNPTYSVEDYKITLSQDGYSEVFDANNYIYSAYCENSKDFVWEDGETYALALYAENTGSKFRINGMCPSACGYRMLNKEGKNEPYDLLDDGYVPTVNNFNFSVGFRNGDLENQYQVDTSLLEDCLYTLNCALPAFNYHVDSNSKNSIVVGDYNETWYGLTLNRNDHIEHKINQAKLINDYGTLNSSTANYNAWKSTVTHEIGHSLGFDDYAGHYPSLYTYHRNRTEVDYLQAPDIFTLKLLYKEKYNIDISKSQEDINSQVAALGLGTSSAYDMPSDEILSIQFDYPMFTSDELHDKADLIIEGKLEFDRCESINIGSEDSPFVLEYNIYKIIPNSVIKGETTNYELKIHVSENIDIGANNTYKLCLKQFKNVPCSLINIEQGIQIKE